jgi:DNA-binding beta-propeller fold protein YncE
MGEVPIGMREPGSTPTRATAGPPGAARGSLSERHQPSPMALAEALARIPVRVASPRVSRRVSGFLLVAASAKALTPRHAAHRPPTRVAGSRAGGSLIATTLLALTLLFFSLTAVASANTARIFTNAFGCEAAGPGCLTPDPYPLASPAGVAVNESTGNVYVANDPGDNIQDIEVDATGGTFNLTFENPLTNAKATTAIVGREVVLEEEHKPTDPKAVEEEGSEISGALAAAGAGPGSFSVVFRNGYVTIPESKGHEGFVERVSNPFYEVHFTGEFADLHVAPLTANTTDLTGAGAAVNITTTSPGGPGDEVQEFTEKGEFVLMFGKDVNKTKALAPLEAERDVCDPQTELAVECQTGTPGSTPGAFERPASVAVDSSTGDVYVADGEHLAEYKQDVPAYALPERVTKFSEKGEVVSSWGDGGPGEEPDGHLVGKAAVGQGAEECVAPAKPCPGAEPFVGISGISIDSKGNLYVDGTFLGEGGARLFQRVFEFARDGIFTGNAVDVVSPVGELGVIPQEYDYGQGRTAVDAAAAGETQYVSDGASGQVSVYSNEVIAAVVTGKPSGVKLPEATLNGTVNPSGVALEQCFFEWGETTAYGEPPVPCAEGLGNGPGEVGAGAVAVPVHATIAGLEAGHVYHYRLVAINKNDVNEPSVGDGQDVVFGPPQVVGEASADVAAVSATVLAEVQAQNLDTHVRVEYGTQAGTYPDKPAAVDGGDRGVVAAVPIELGGLTHGTVYHYRFVTENALGEFVGPDHAFKTQGAGVFVLPDNRSWELVSPPDLHGSAIEPLDSGNEGTADGGGGAVKAAAAGGAIGYVTSAPVEPDVRGYQEFSQALSRRVGGGGAGTSSSGWSSRALSVAHAPATPTGLAFKGREYRWFSEDLSLAAVEPSGGFVPPSLEETQTGALTALGGTFLGATPDGSHTVVATGNPAEGIFDLSESSAGRPLAPVGVGELGGQDGNYSVARNAISDDGSRVFFSNATGLYMTDLVKGETVLIAGGSAVFEDANADGSLVFYDRQEGTSEGVECEVIANPGTGDLECPVIAQDGLLIGSSVDGSWFYYGINSELFVSHDGVSRLISSDSGPIGSSAHLRQMTARVSPNGQWLAFMSERSLTGYDNRDAVSGEPNEEVYLYDAQTGQLACASCNPTGARPHGRKYGLGDSSHETGISAIPLVGGMAEWDASTWLAANVPGWTQAGEGNEGEQPAYQPRYLSNSGRLFFNSSDALVPKDGNEQEDVYEYEPENVPSGRYACSPSSGSGSEVYKPAQPFEVEGVKDEEGAGCVSLISSGTSPDESAFLDASESGGEGPHGEELQEGGGDVFFLTASHLQPQDVEDGNAIYDAHECTSESPCSTPPSPAPECTTAEGCRAAPEPQPGIYGAPPSATFNGLGNLTPAVTLPAVVKPKSKTVKCKRPKKLTHNKCVRAKAKKQTNRKRRK